MKKCYYLLAIIALVVLTANCNGGGTGSSETGNENGSSSNINFEKTDLHKYEINGWASELKLLCYAAFGKYGSVIQSDLLRGGIEVYEFNKSGYKTVISKFEYPDEIMEKEIFSYIDNKLDSVWKYSESELYSLSTYGWEGDKMISAKTVIGRHKITATIGYEGDLKKSQISYWGNELLENYVITKHDGELALEEEHYDKSGKITNKVTREWHNGKLAKYVSNKDSYSIEYNEKNLPIKSIGCSAIMGEITPTYKNDTYYYEYEYDDKDSWIKVYGVEYDFDINDNIFVSTHIRFDRNFKETTKTTITGNPANGLYEKLEKVITIEDRESNEIETTSTVYTYKYNANNILSEETIETTESDGTKSTKRTVYEYTNSKVYPTNIAEIEADGETVQVSGLAITAADDAQLVLYTANGAKVAEAYGTITAPQAGMYIVKCNGKAFKVTLK